jgi:hypothetical protein
VAAEVAVVTEAAGVVTVALAAEASTAVVLEAAFMEVWPAVAGVEAVLDTVAGVAATS